MQVQLIFWPESQFCMGCISAHFVDMEESSSYICTENHCPDGLGLDGFCSKRKKNTEGN